MIEGLKFHVEGVEIRDHLQRRLEHHRQRQAFYEQKVSELQSGGAEAMQYTNGDPVRALGDKAAQHKQTIELFVFMHDHIRPSEQYQLADEDLRRLEIISARW
jgi:hypothetical protein